MFTAEEIENFDIFPKEYSFSCLFKFIFHSLTSIFSFLLLYAFYTDSDIYKIITMNYNSNNNYKGIIINDYLTRKLVELTPKHFLSSENNKTNFIQKYENLKNIFFKEYIMNSHPCLIKNSSEFFRVKEIIGLVEENLLKNTNLKIRFEYKENPYVQFYDSNYQYLITSYNTYINMTNINNRNNTKNNNYYFINEYNIRDIISFNNKSLLDIIINGDDSFLKNNFLVNDLYLKDIYFSSAETFVVVWGHMEIDEQFICVDGGNLEFILIPPHEKKNMYPFIKKGPINYSMVNFFDGKNNNNENFPNFFEVKKIYYNLQSGECLYIPAFWWLSYRTSKKKNLKTKYLTFKYYSNSKYIDQMMFVRNDF